MPTPRAVPHRNPWQVFSHAQQRGLACVHCGYTFVSDGEKKSLRGPQQREYYCCTDVNACARRVEQARTADTTTK